MSTEAKPDESLTWDKLKHRYERMGTTTEAKQQQQSEQLKIAYDIFEQLSKDQLFSTASDHRAWVRKLAHSGMLACMTMEQIKAQIGSGFKSRSQN
jgi:hypothetical protein